jgi:hypothetical protein
VQTASRTGNGLDRGKLNGDGAAATSGGTLGAFAKSRKPWTPPKETLAPEASAALRDRLAGELAGVATADEVTVWAQRALGAKNTLRDVDAAVVEAAFASRLAELGDGGPLPSPAVAGESFAEGPAPPSRADLMAALRASVELGTSNETPQPPLPAERRTRRRQPREQAPPALPIQSSAPSQRSVLSKGPTPAQPEAPPVNNAVVWHVDKSTLPLSEPRRYRDRAHLEFVASQPCLRCGRLPSDAHHLRFMQPRALGRRVSDEFAVPLCRTHHREIHRHGDEASWWKTAGIEAVAVAHRLWQHTRLKGTPIQEHMDPLLSAPSVRGVEAERGNPSSRVGDH